MRKREQILALCLAAAMAAAPACGPPPDGKVKQRLKILKEGKEALADLLSNMAEAPSR